MDFTSLYQRESKYSINNKKANSLKRGISAIGDFDYDRTGADSTLTSDCSSTDFFEEINLNSLYNVNRDLIADLNKKLDDVYRDVEEITDRLDCTEEDVFKRKDYLRDIKRLGMECVKQIGKEIEQMEKTDFLIEHLNRDVSTRDLVIERFKKIDADQLHNHFQYDRASKSCSGLSSRFDSVV